MLELEAEAALKRAMSVHAHVEAHRGHRPPPPSPGTAAAASARKKKNAGGGKAAAPPPPPKAVAALQRKEAGGGGKLKRGASRQKLQEKARRRALEHKKSFRLLVKQFRALDDAALAREVAGAEAELRDARAGNADHHDARHKKMLQEHWGAD